MTLIFLLFLTELVGLVDSLEQNKGSKKSFGSELVFSEETGVSAIKNDQKML